MSETNTEKPSFRPTRKDIILMTAETLAFIGQVLLCFLFYNWLRQSWLLHFGWALLLVATIPGWRARVAFETKGQAPQGKSWLQTTTMVDTGIYAIVRHPMYLSFMLLALALLCISQHWLSLILGMALILMLYDNMQSEEKGSIQKFGDDYLRYMQKVPRVNFVTGIIRYVQREKKQ